MLKVSLLAHNYQWKDEDNRLAQIILLIKKIGYMTYIFFLYYAVFLD